jgi:hypothetical protein
METRAASSTDTAASSSFNCPASARGPAGRPRVVREARRPPAATPASGVGLQQAVLDRLELGPGSSGVRSSWRYRRPSCGEDPRRARRHGLKPVRLRFRPRADVHLGRGRALHPARGRRQLFDRFEDPPGQARRGQEREDPCAASPRKSTVHRSRNCAAPWSGGAEADRYGRPTVRPVESRPGRRNLRETTCAPTARSIRMPPAGSGWTARREARRGRDQLVVRVEQDELLLPFLRAR